MKIVSAWSVAEDAAEAASEAIQKAVESLAQQPDMVLLHCTVAYDFELVAKAVAEHAPQATFLAGTSCRGVMTDQGFHSRDGRGLALLAIADAEGSYGSAIVPKGGDPRAAAQEVARKAVEAAGRPGEVPDAVLLVVAPGQEEAVIDGLCDHFGPEVPVMGGSSADEDISGNWKQCAGGEVQTDGVAIMTLYPSTSLGTAFHSGYEPTEHRGKVTRSLGRTIFSIDGKPAADVYSAWTTQQLPSAADGEADIIGMTTMHPLGREVGTVGGIPTFLLSHLIEVTDERAIVVYTAIEEGDELVLMTGTRDSLTARAGRAVKAAVDSGDLAGQPMSGAVVVFCAGCMRAVSDRLEEVGEVIQRELSGAPFLCTFTYGEQGCFVGGENRHGNLMIAGLVLGGGGA